jgi:hypothetical protein
LATGISAFAHSDVNGPTMPITLRLRAYAFAFEAHLRAASGPSVTVESSQAW